MPPSSTAACLVVCREWEDLAKWLTMASSVIPSWVSKLCFVFWCVWGWGEGEGGASRVHFVTKTSYADHFLMSD